MKVASDTLGKYSVEGSEESEKLRQVEEDFAAFVDKFPLMPPLVTTPRLQRITLNITVAASSTL